MHATIVTDENRHDFFDDIKLMFQQRYSVFVEQMAWNLPMADHDKKVEKDQFDTHHAIYLLLKDDDDNLIGSLRFLPTTQPHLFSEIFSHLIDGDVSRSDEIWECSRFYTVTRTGKESGLLSRSGAALGAAMVEVTLLYGIKQIVTLVNHKVLPMILNSGSLTMPIGMPQIVDNEMVSSIALQVTPVGLQVYRKRRNITHSILQTIPQKEKVAV